MTRCLKEHDRRADRRVLTDSQVLEAARRYRAGATVMALSAEYGVAHNTMSRWLFEKRGGPGLVRRPSNNIGRGRSEETKRRISEGARRVAAERRALGIKFWDRLPRDGDGDD
jgi:transposase